jgi:tetratricopeptide (TPR) repeat protein
MRRSSCADDMRPRAFKDSVHVLGRRRKGGLEDLFARVAARAERSAEDRARETAAAEALARELLAMPDAEHRLEAVEREPRFWTFGLVEHLLEASTAAGPDDAGRLPELALAIVRRLPANRYGETLLVEQEILAWSLSAERHRRQGDLSAARESFRAAARRLTTEFLDGLERAIYCRYLARLRRDQDRPDEALALLQRAAELFETWGEPFTAGEALGEAGWLCLDAGDVPSAQPFLERAAILLHRAPNASLVIRTLHGLALCYAELAQPADAEQALHRAGALYERVPGQVERLRFQATEGRAASHMGQAGRAVSLLGAALSGLLARAAFYDAAVAALDLAQIHAAQGNRAELAWLVQETASLGAPGALPEHAQAVWLLAVRFALRREQHAVDLLACTSEFLERGRERPWLRFSVEGPVGAELSWDLLDDAFRRRLCEEAGVPAETSALAAVDMPALHRDLVSWTHELLASTRIVFETPAYP